MEDYKAILGAVGIFLAMGAYVPYLVSAIKGASKPHIFSWIIWTLLSGIVFAGQIAGGAGPGSWTTGMTTLICVFITIAAFRSGEKEITKSDIFMFVAGLGSIPVWVLTDDPVWSIWIVTLIDLAAFYSTFRKSWKKPWEENSFMYGFNIIRHSVGLVSLAQFNTTTALFPAAMLVLNAAMYCMIKSRRSYLAKEF